MNYFFILLLEPSSSSITTPTALSCIYLKNTVMSRQLNPPKIKKEVIALLSRCKTKLYAAPNLFNLFIQLKQHK